MVEFKNKIKTIHMGEKHQNYINLFTFLGSVHFSAKMAKIGSKCDSYWPI